MVFKGESAVLRERHDRSWALSWPPALRVASGLLTRAGRIDYDAGAAPPEGTGPYEEDEQSMARKGGRGQPPIKGFRPGKAPPQLKKKRAKALVGDDASWAQKQTIDAIAGRSPQEVRGMVRKWSLGLFVGAALLAIVGVPLYRWAVWAGVVAYVVGVVLVVLAYRIRKQGPGMVQIAESLK